MSTPNVTSSAVLKTDDIDDLIYAARTNDLDELKDVLPKWAAQLEVTEAEILTKATDVDEEGLGSRACLLHYPAANGNLEMVQYLLSLLVPTQPSPVQSNGTSTSATTNGSINPNHSEAVQLVNHQNVSGNTPLHWAALNGHLEIVKALVKAGADPTIVNEAGRDAVVEAEYSAKDEAAECATWMLRECDVLESGAGGAQAGQGEPEQEDDMQDSVKDVEDVDGKPSNGSS